ncbi:transposase, partial [Candidatus Magnetomorum sp. HK-1]
MEVSQATIQTIYTLRLTPIIQNVFKKKNWTVGKKDFQRILSLTFENFSKFQPDTFIGLTDEDLIYELYNQFESGPLADFLFSIEGLQVRRSNYDIRHKETLRLFLREYFELFFPDLAAKMNFNSVMFMDKELIALFGGEHRITDALILIEIIVNDESKWIMIHWEQQSNKQSLFEERMFHCFCGIYFQYRKLVFPIAMFTDTAKWEKPIPD